MTSSARHSRLPLALRFALRELRGGFAGFRVFLGCLSLGVAAIAGVGTLVASLLAGMAGEGKALLAGDAELRLFQRELTDEQYAWLAERGTISDTLSLRSNAFAPGTGERALVELRAVDDLYPLYGELLLTPAIGTREALGERNGRLGIVVDPLLADRLGVAIGDALRVGNLDFELRALIAREPDRANTGFQLGPSAMIDRAAADATGLLVFGSLVSYHYKIRLAPGTPLAAWRAELAEAWPDADWRVRTYENSAPGIRRFLDRMGSFLTLVGLTALVVGGVGVGNAVRAWLDRKADSIATLKVLGASGATVFSVYLAQVMLMAGIAVIVGLAVGTAVPFALAGLLSDRLPVPPRGGFYPEPLAVAAVYGLLITLIFTALPLGRARDVPAARLFRTIVAPGGERPRAVYLLLAGGAALTVIAVAVLLSAQPWLSAGFAAAATAALLLLRGTGWAVERLAARLPRPRHAGLRLAIANLHRPGAATGPAIVSLGLGLTLFVALVLIEGNMNREVSRQIPERAPAFFFVDIQAEQYEDFVATASALPGVSNLETVPSLRGSILEVKGVPADEAPVAPGSAWVLRGDRGISYAVDFPEGNRLVAGAWWPADYAGPPLISFAAEEAIDLGLGIGDTVTVGVLGRAITAEIASLREVEWGTFGFNFVILFDPHTLAAAPHSYMATLAAEGEAEARAYRALTDRFPNVTAVRIREVLASVNDILGDIGDAVRVTAVIAILSGILVLAGAMAAGHRNRVHDSVVLRILGAVRSDILRAHVLEYALLGGLTALVALALGTLAGRAVVVEVMEMDFTLFPLAMIGTVVASATLTVLFGLVGTWAALAARPAHLLRMA